MQEKYRTEGAAPTPHVSARAQPAAEAAGTHSATAGDGDTIITALASGQAELVQNPLADSTESQGATPLGDGHSLITALAAGQLGTGTAPAGAGTLMSKRDFAAALLRAVQDPGVIDQAYGQYEGYFVRTTAAAEEKAALAAEVFAAAQAEAEAAAYVQAQADAEVAAVAAEAAAVAAAEEEAAARQSELERVAKEGEKRRKEAERVEAIMAAADALALHETEPVDATGGGQTSGSFGALSAFDALVQGTLPLLPPAGNVGIDHSAPAATAGLSAFDALVTGQLSFSQPQQHMAGDRIGSTAASGMDSGSLSPFDALVQKVSASSSSAAGPGLLQSNANAPAVGAASNGMSTLMSMIQQSQPQSAQTLSSLEQQVPAIYLHCSHALDLSAERSRAG